MGRLHLLATILVQDFFPDVPVSEVKKQQLCTQDFLNCIHNTKMYKSSAMLWLRYNIERITCVSFFYSLEFVWDFLSTTLFYPCNNFVQYVWLTCSQATQSALQLNRNVNLSTLSQSWATFPLYCMVWFLLVTDLLKKKHGASFTFPCCFISTQ